MPTHALLAANGQVQTRTPPPGFPAFIILPARAVRPNAKEIAYGSLGRQSNRDRRCPFAET